LERDLGEITGGIAVAARVIEESRITQRRRLTHRLRYDVTRHRVLKAHPMAGYQRGRVRALPRRRTVHPIERAAVSRKKEWLRLHLGRGHSDPHGGIRRHG